jgi:hypothetical protein
MITTARGHWDGDPVQHCGELAVVAETQIEAVSLAALHRLLSHPNAAVRLEWLMTYADVVIEAERVGQQIPF